MNLKGKRRIYCLRADKSRTKTLRKATKMTDTVGRIIKISGSVALAEGMQTVKMHGIVLVGDKQVLAEAVEIDHNTVTLCFLESAQGISVGDRAVPCDTSFTAELGPGLLGHVFDAVQRPIFWENKKSTEAFHSAVSRYSLDQSRLRHFEAALKFGDKVKSGDVYGTVRENGMVIHKITVPCGVSGSIVELRSGDYNVTDRIGKIKRQDGTIEDITLASKQNVSYRRHKASRRPPDEKLITNIDDIDRCFPIAKGGAACIAGQSGSGKTSLLHKIARNADADIVVYVSASLRSKEVSELFAELSDTADPKSGRPLIERTVMIASSADMSAAAREKAVYLGATVAEYYRDMGYSVLLIIDSITDWASSVREKAFELDREFDLYPANIDSRISELFARCGSFAEIGSERRRAALTVIVSAEDNCDTVLQAVKRNVGAFCLLDAPSSDRIGSAVIDESKSYSKYKEKLRRI